MDRQTGGRYYHLRIDQLCKALRIDARKFHYIKAIPSNLLVYMKMTSFFTYQGEVRKLVIQHMDVRLPYTQQPPDDIETVERKVSERLRLAPHHSLTTTHDRL